MTAETPKYNPEEIKDSAKRQETAQDIGKRKAEIKYDKETPEGRKTLSDEWMKKANLSEAQIKAIDDKLWILSTDSEEIKDEKKKKWQKENGLDDDGVLGWKSLEKLDTQITEEVTQNDDSLSSNPDLNGLQHIESEDVKQKESDRDETLEEALKDDYIDDGEALLDKDNNTLTRTELNGEKVLMGTLENEGKIYDVEKKIYETPEDRESRVASDKILDLTKTEGEWGVEKTGKADKIDETQYFRDGEKVIKYEKNPSGETVYTVADIKDGKVWEFQNTKYEELPSSFRWKNASILAEQLKTDFWDKKIADISSDKPEITRILEKIRDTADTSSPQSMKGESYKGEKIGDLTVNQYIEFSKNPDSFASSDFVKNAKGPVDPEEYGIKSDYTYAMGKEWRKIAIPRGGANLDTIKIADTNGEFKSQREWLESFAKRDDITANKRYSVEGSPDLEFQKQRREE